jgi:putative endopeptidase
MIHSQEKVKGDFLTNAMDTTIDPGDNFFEYATGTWMKENPIPASERRWGLSNLVNEETYSRLKGILQEAAANQYPEGTSRQKIGDFYFTGMDTVTIEKKGLSPVQPELDKINSINTKKDLFETVAYLQKEGVSAMFGLFVEQDTKNSEQYALYIWQGGLGLPNREYYFRDDARTQNIRNEYKTHLANMLELEGYPKSEAEMENNKIFQLDNFLADSCRKLEDLRDPYANYNKMSVSELEKNSPNVDWKLTLKSFGAENVDSVIVGQPEFIHQLSAAIDKFSLDDWKAYLKFHLLREFAGTLSSKYDNERFHFYGTVMSGVTEQKPRW